MISYIVASNDTEVLNRNLIQSLYDKDNKEDQIIVVDETSIFRAYNAGIKKAKNKIKCFIHNDVIVLNVDLLRKSIINECTNDRGIIGVIGTKNKNSIPWWEPPTDCCGSVVDGRLGLIKFDDGGCECSLLDGLLLATNQDIEFDERYSGFHIYDHDICMEMMKRGYKNYCLKNGRSLVFHNTKNTTDVNKLNLFQVNTHIYKNKWGLI